MTIIVQAEELTELSQKIFVGIGTPDDIALAVAESLVHTNLLGHDSHGILRVKQYINMIRDGMMFPTERPKVLKQFGAVATVVGGYGFGQIAARLGAELASELGKTHGIGAVSIGDVNHVGRLGEYTKMLADEGLIGIGFTGGTMYRGWVTPYGGREKLFGTNPMSFAVPTSDGETLLLDFATSGIAQGKVTLAQAKGEALPEGMMLDKDGNPSTDPSILYDGAVLLPMGLHKGSGLAMMMEIVPTLLATHKPISSSDFKHGNPTLLIAISLEAFTDRESFHHYVDELTQRVKNVKPAKGFDEVLLPGEKESRAFKERVQSGIPVPDSVWEDLQSLAIEFNVL